MCGAHSHMSGCCGSSKGVAEIGASDVSLVVRAWPLELVNGVPLDAGLISQKVRTFRDQVAPNLFRGLDSAPSPSTSMPALRLEAARASQSAAAGNGSASPYGRQCSNTGVTSPTGECLREIAASCGVDDPVPVSDNDVIEDWLAGKQRGVVGSPHFFAAEGNWFCPSLTITQTDDGLWMADNQHGLDRLAAICLGRAEVR